MIVKVWKDKKGDAKRMDRLKAAGVDINKTYTEDKLAKGKEMIFAASGVTKGEMLDGYDSLLAAQSSNQFAQDCPAGPWNGQLPT
jgi:fructose-1,6-bisphosphatase/sedoheptulose 1,7-bisphosphatase-like protein